MATRPWAACEAAPAPCELCLRLAFARACFDRSLLYDSDIGENLAAAKIPRSSPITIGRSGPPALVGVPWRKWRIRSSHLGHPEITIMYI